MGESLDIVETIRTTCRAALGYADLQFDDDFFDRGASSLTIVALQIQVERELNLRVSTSELMAAPSMNGWSEAYTAAAGSRGSNVG